MLQNEEVCGNTIYSSSEASGVNHIIHTTSETSSTTQNAKK